MAEQFWKNKIEKLKEDILLLSKKNKNITKVIDDNYNKTVKQASKDFIKNYNKRHRIFLWITIISGTVAIVLIFLACLYSDEKYGSGLGIIAGIISSAFIALLIQTLAEYDKIKSVLKVRNKYINDISVTIEPILSNLMTSERFVGKNIDCELFKPTIRIENKIIDINPDSIAVNFALLDQVVKRKLLDSPSIKVNAESFENFIKGYQCGDQKNYYNVATQLNIIEQHILQDNNLYDQKLFTDTELVTLGKLKFAVQQIHNCHYKSDFHLINSLVVAMLKAIDLFVIAGLDITKQIYHYCGKEKLNTFCIAAFSFKDIINNVHQIKKHVSDVLDKSGIQK